MVTIAAEVQEAIEYLDSNIIDLLTMTKPSTSMLPSQADTFWDSNYPSVGE